MYGNEIEVELKTIPNIISQIQICSWYEIYNRFSLTP